jgi:hypothetical protein
MTPMRAIGQTPDADDGLRQYDLIRLESGWRNQRGPSESEWKGAEDDFTSRDHR